MYSVYKVCFIIMTYPDSIERMVEFNKINDVASRWCFLLSLPTSNLFPELADPTK